MILQESYQICLIPRADLQKGLYELQPLLILLRNSHPVGIWVPHVDQVKFEVWTVHINQVLRGTVEAVGAGEQQDLAAMLKNGLVEIIGGWQRQVWCEVNLRAMLMVHHVPCIVVNRLQLAHHAGELCEPTADQFRGLWKHQAV